MPRRPTCDCGTCAKCKHRAYMHLWYWRNRDHACELARTSRERHIEKARATDRARGFRRSVAIKHKARHAVDHALRLGKLTKGPCERESADCCGRIEAHHDDYSRPLDVRWLCQRHHGIEHRSAPPDGLLQHRRAAV